MMAGVAASKRQNRTIRQTILGSLAGCCVSASALGQTGQQSIPILIAPPMTWDNSMSLTKPSLGQTVTNFGLVSGGMVFGMKPEEVNARLPSPVAGINWTVLPPAAEFIAEVRYFWARLDGLSGLRGDITACTGRNSYVVFLFQPRGLFRLSFRLVPDPGCPNPGEAASEIFRRFVAIDWNIAQSVHYRAGETEIVDVTDPASGSLTTVRWQPRVR